MNQEIKRNRQLVKGFSLIELCCIIFILAILVSIGTSLFPLSKSSTFSSHLFEIQQRIHQARHDASTQRKTYLIANQLNTLAVYAIEASSNDSILDAILYQKPLILSPNEALYSSEFHSYSIRVKGVLRTVQGFTIDHHQQIKTNAKTKEIWLQFCDLKQKARLRIHKKLALTRAEYL